MRTQRFRKSRPVHTALALVAWLSMLVGPPAQAATVPAGFSETLVASGLASPTAMQFAPDGRLFVAEQGGRLRVIKDGALLPTPFLTLTVSSVGVGLPRFLLDEELLSVLKPFSETAFDFASSHTSAAPTCRPLRAARHVDVEHGPGMADGAR